MIVIGSQQVPHSVRDEDITTAATALQRTIAAVHGLSRDDVMSRDQVVVLALAIAQRQYDSRVRAAVRVASRVAQA